MAKCIFYSINQVVSQIWIKIYMKSPSPLRGCVSRSRMSGALEVMTLYYANQTEFGVWVFGVHYLSANKVSQACEGPGVKHEGV